MGKYVIDGLFLTKRITGIQRFSYEICSELDKIVKKDEFEILVPKRSNIKFDYKNIKIIEYGYTKGLLWEQIDLLRYLRKEKKYGVFLCNVFPILLKEGFIVIHDVSYKANPKFFKGLRNILSMYWHRVNYYFATKNLLKIASVSQFSKFEIAKYYGVPSKEITIVSNSYEHINRIIEDTKIFIKWGFLKKNNYYFAMSTIAENKNFKWILNEAKHNPNLVFAIAGSNKQKHILNNAESLDNVHYLGYVSDEEAKALMHNCKAFIFPSLYEGFGIPPLEALASGCDSLILSDIPVLHEIYGDSINYIDPLNYCSTNINSNIKVNPKDILKNYSWAKSAATLYKTIVEETK